MTTEHKLINLLKNCIAETNWNINSLADKNGALVQEYVKMSFDYIDGMQKLLKEPKGAA
jgi:hypothetical protein